MAAVEQVGARPALVSRPPARASDPAQYLLLTPQGSPTWTSDPASATIFESMRESARAAVRLPSGLRAFGVPLRSVLLAGSLVQ